MFTSEIVALSGFVTSAVPSSLAENAQTKLKVVANLSKSMGKIIKNILAEVERTREELLRVLENVVDM